MTVLSTISNGACIVLASDPALLSIFGISLLGLSMLELSLVIAMVHLTKIYDGEPFNFEMVYKGD